MPAKSPKTIGILTSGGDCPGMNCSIRAVVRTALGEGMAVKGIVGGYAGIFNENRINVYSFDLRGHGNSGGERANISTFDEFGDTRRWRTLLKHLKHSGVMRGASSQACEAPLTRKTLRAPTPPPSHRRNVKQTVAKPAAAVG